MDSTDLSSADFEILRWSWNYALERQIPFMQGTANFSSEFFAKPEGLKASTIDDRFKVNGVEPLRGKDGRPIKTGTYFFYNLFEVRRVFTQLE